MTSPLVPGADIPETIGPFRVVRLLGRGGSGVVYLGERIELFAQRVALKLLNPVMAGDSQSGRLDHEGQILTALDHPGIVRFLDTGEYRPGFRYIAMEYVEGVPVDEFCDVARLTVMDRIRLLIQIIESIDYAHRRLIIHGDLKPTNILVTSEGQPKLLDFGVATIYQPRSNGRARYEFVPMDHTPAFASPEQKLGAAVTPVSDVYSLGLIAGVVLAGVSPGAIAESGGLVDAWTELAGAEREEIADRRRTSPEALRGALRGELESIVGKAVREDPEDRYLSVHAFANDLKAVLESRPVLAHRGSRVYGVRKWMQRHQAATIFSFLLLTVVGMSAFGVALQGVRAADQRRLAQTRLHDLVRLTGVLDGELYESARSVSKSDEARAVLLKGAADTLNKLSTDADKDPALEIELARQYKKLAQLHLDDTGADVSEQRRAASQSLEHGIALLNSLPKQDAQTLTMRDEMLSARQKIAE